MKSKIYYDVDIKKARNICSKAYLHLTDELNKNLNYTLVIFPHEKAYGSRIVEKEINKVKQSMNLIYVFATDLTLEARHYLEERHISYALEHEFFWSDKSLEEAYNSR